MKKAKLSMLVLACVVATSLSTGVLAQAKPVQNEGTTIEEKAPDKGDQGGEEGDKGDQGGETDGAPVIKVAKEKFLIEKGTEFDLAKELGLQITDAVDGDLTSQVKIPTIDTNQVGLSTFNIKAENKKHKKSELAVKINVISFLESKSFDSFDQVQTVAPEELVSGNKKELKITTENINAETSTFDVVVSDGVNTLKKTIKALNKEGKPFANGADANAQAAAASATSTGAGNLPKTGDIATTGIGVAGLVTLLGTGYFFKRRK